MDIQLEELTVSLHEVNPDDLLSEWRWLVDKSFTLLLISALGDMFLAASDGSVFWLETGWGSLIKIADTLDMFKTMALQPEYADEWFNPQLVKELSTHGLSLKKGQCYSYKIPPSLGGKIEPANFESTDLSVHFSLLGQIQNQVKDLPPGTQIIGVRLKK